MNNIRKKMERIDEVNAIMDRYEQQRSMMEDELFANNDDEETGGGFYA